MHHLISYFLRNISAKNYRNLIECVKIIASQRWGVFWNTVKYCAAKIYTPKTNFWQRTW